MIFLSQFVAYMIRCSTIQNFSPLITLKDPSFTQSQNAYYNKSQQFQLNMINPFIKNCRTGFHDDILNRTSHYKKVLQTKAKIDNQVDKIYLTTSNKQINRNGEQQKGQQNLRIFKKLMSIERKTPRYKTDSVNSQGIPKKTLKSYYREKQKSLMISEDNVRLLKKIDNIESDFSLKKLHHESYVSKNKKNGDQIKRINLIDDLYYKSFRMELFRGRIESKIEKLSLRKSKPKNKQNSKYLTLQAYEQFRSSLKNDIPQ